jgi:hypothetical protein
MLSNNVIYLFADLFVFDVSKLAHKSIWDEGVLYFDEKKYTKTIRKNYNI